MDNKELTTENGSKKGLEAFRDTKKTSLLKRYLKFI